MSARNVLLALTVLAVASGCMPYTTGTNEVGVRTRKLALFSERGIEDKVYPPASTYFFLPFINDWHTFDTRSTSIEMTAMLKRGDRPGKDDLVFKTIDGNDIGLDIVVSYHVVPEKAPEILRTVATSDAELKENIIRTITRSKPRDIFGELQTEEFYLADKRSEKAAAVAKELNAMLAPFGIVVERVGTGDYRFNPEYSRAIEERKVADQTTEKAKSETRAVEKEYLTRVETAKGEVARTKAKADGEFERAKIEADAEFEKQKQIAEAIRAEGIADAEGVRKMNAALSAPGGEAVVKLAIIDALKGKKIVSVPMGTGIDLRSLDMNQFLESVKANAAPVEAPTEDVTQP